MVTQRYIAPLLHRCQLVHFLIRRFIIINLDNDVIIHFVFANNHLVFAFHLGTLGSLRLNAYQKLLLGVDLVIVPVRI
jgi:hypothetical protein